MSFRNATAADYRYAAGNPASYLCTFVAALSFGTALYFGSWVGYLTAGIYILLALHFIDRDVNTAVTRRRQEERDAETAAVVERSKALRARVENLGVELGLRCPDDCASCAQDEKERMAELAAFLADRARRHGHGIAA